MESIIAKSPQVISTLTVNIKQETTKRESDPFADIIEVDTFCDP